MEKERESAYLDIIKKLYSINVFGGMKLNLNRIETLLAYLGNPHHSMNVIHVAGTNGKGSVCIKVASSLMSTGSNVGLFTSPHLFSFRERIKVNGLEISQEDVVNVFGKVLSVDQSYHLEATFFEVLVAAAFEYFAKMQVNIAVLETGIGGRFDATNIVTPIVSVITSIGWDHMEILGDTLEKIAYDKAGIIKEQVPIVLGPRAQGVGIEKIAEEKKAPLYISSFKSSNYLEENTQTAKLVLDVIHQKCPEWEINLKGLETNQECRFKEISYKGHLFVMDVSHNIDGLKSLFSMLKARYRGRSIRALISLGKKKGLDAIKKVFITEAAELALLDIEHYRLMPVDQLQDFFSGEPKVKHIQRCKLKTFIDSLPQSNEWINVCTGSFYLMQEMFEALDIPIDADPINLQEWRTTTAIR